MKKTEMTTGLRQGAALAMVVIFTLVLSILAAAVYLLFRSNVQSHEWKENEIRALFAAEAGASLAIHNLEMLNRFPGSTEPFSLAGDSAQWIVLPGSGDKAWVVIDPCDAASVPDRISCVEIRSRGMAGETTVDVSIRAVPDFPSRYAMLLDESVPHGFFTDNRIIDGPVHANGRIEFSSSSPDSSNDPFVMEISTTKDGGFFFSGYGYSDIPHPPGSNIWVRPYTRHSGGEPYWNNTAGEINFNRLRNYFGSLVSEASAQSSLFSQVKRILLDGNRILLKRDESCIPDTVYLENSNLIFLSNGNTPVLIKSLHPLEGTLTIISTGPCYIAGQIEASLASAGGPLGIVSLGDIVVANDPDLTGLPDWSSPWDISTNTDIYIYAFLAAPDGQLRAENPSYPRDKKRLTVFGGLLQQRFGSLGTTRSGYELQIAYDSGLAENLPPHFPILEYWEVLSWEQDPDYDNRNIDDNMF